MNLLVGDVGGTKTLFRLARAESQEPLAERRFENLHYPSFVDVIRDFLGTLPPQELRAMRLACFAVAGPVSGGRARLTNLPWTLAEEELAKELGVEVRLINDFEAAAYGLPALDASRTLTLQSAPVANDGVRLVLGPGTGLGQALLVPLGDVERAVCSEAGHTDFAPADALQRRLLEHLQMRRGRVSHEHVLSGAGLYELYRFLRDGHAGERPPAEAPGLRRALQDGDPAAVITRFAVERHDPLARRAAELFCRLLGGYAGNAALQCLPRGGVYVAGGVAQHLRSVMAAGGFVEAFRDKPPMEELLARIPVFLVLDRALGLLGAWRHAARLLSAAR